MSQCTYCDRTYETDEELVEHLHRFHDREELSAVDRRWVERYVETASESEPDASTTSDADGTLDRRQLMALAGASTLGIAGMTVGLAEQNSLSVGDLPGLGNQNSPIQIATLSELLAIDNDLSADYVLVDDIDATGEPAIDPLASSGTFTGTLDGQGHEIVGLEINALDVYGRAGLFQVIGSNATIESLHLVDVSVTGETDVAGLVSKMYDGTVRNCSVTGQIDSVNLEEFESPGKVGGIVGDQSGGTIEGCWTDATISSVGSRVGGLAGKANGTIVSSYAQGAISGDTETGGVVGENTGTVRRTYAAGDVTGTNNVGGFAGVNGSIQTIENSYWDEVATNQSDGVGTNVGTINNLVGFATDDLTGRADEMTGADAATNMTALDFGGTWQTVEDGAVLGDVVATEDGYPILSGVDSRVQLEAQGVAFDEVTTGIELEGKNATLDNVTVEGDGN
jgi:hypothetical protein